MKNNHTNSPLPKTTTFVDEVIRRENRKRIASVREAMKSDKLDPEVRKRLQALIDNLIK
jgi:hypothetical protein